MTDSLRYFFDENLLPIGRALAAVRSDVVHPGHERLPQVQRGAKDPEWLPVVGAEGLDLVVFTQDKRIRTKPGELLLLQQHGVRVMNFAPKKDRDRWAKFVLIVRSWDRIEVNIRRAGPGPWVYSIQEAKIVQLSLPAD